MVRCTALLGRTRRRRSGRRRHRVGSDETAPAAATHLAALAPGASGLVGGPFVRCSLFMRGPPALARDLPLLLRRHRCESSTFLAFSIHHAGPPVFNQARSTYAPGRVVNRATRRLESVPCVMAVGAPASARSAANSEAIHRDIHAQPALIGPQLYQSLCHGPG